MIYILLTQVDYYNMSLNIVSYFIY